MGKISVERKGSRQNTQREKVDYDAVQPSASLRFEAFLKIA